MHYQFRRSVWPPVVSLLVVAVVWLWVLLSQGSSLVALIGIPAIWLGLYILDEGIYRFNNRLVLGESALEVRRGGSKLHDIYSRRGEKWFTSKRATIAYRDILAVRIAEDNWVEVDVDPATGVPDEFHTIAIPAKEPYPFANELALRVQNAKHATTV